MSTQAPDAAATPAPCAPDWLDSMARRATTLAERLASVRAGSGVVPASDDTTTHARWSRWREVVGRNDPGTFARRLRWDGLSDARIASALRDPHTADGGAMAVAAVWTADFLDFFGDRGPDTAADDVRPHADVATDIPFGVLFVPAAAAARARLAARVGAAHERLDAHAHAELDRALVERLARVCARALYAHFAVERGLRQPLGILGAAVPGTFATFTRRMRGGGLLEFFREYPVAARLCTAVCTTWVDATVEFLLRLDSDFDALQGLCGPDPLGAVTSVQPGAGDTHAGGRSVCIVRFASGQRCVYKPRDVGLEREFAHLLAWFNARVPEFALRAADVLARERHGWVAYVEHEPCENEAAVARFFRRGGALLCLAYALNGSDLHLDNLIANGEFPVLVDLEAVLTHRAEVVDQIRGHHAGASDTGHHTMADSVLSTMMLPGFKLDSTGRAVDTGGFASATGPSDHAVSVAAWADVNTDGMRLVRHAVVHPLGSANAPILDGRRIDAADYTREVLEGFERSYAVLVTYRHELTCDGGIVDRLARHPVRFIFRHTNLYGTLIERTLHPQFLRSGIERGIEIEALAQPLAALEGCPSVWPLLRAEVVALDRLDVPIFTAPAGSTTLPLEDTGEVAHCFRASAVQQARRRLASLGPSDLATQRTLIQAAFAAHAARGLDAAPAASGRHPVRRGTAPTREPGPTDLLKAACGIADMIRACAFGAGRDVSWPALAYVPSAERYRAQAATANLFDGYCGTALFFAALARATGESRYGHFAADIITPLLDGRDDLTRSTRSRRQPDLGAGTGIGSAVYALARIGALLGRGDVLDAARRLCALITPEAVTANPAHDLLAGTAGAAVAALALFDVCGHQDAYEAARVCGDHILAAAAERSPVLLGHVAAGADAPAGDVGIACGAVGRALALARLYAAGHDPRWRDAARRLLAPPHDVGPLADADAVSAWGRGLTGVGLAHLAAQSLGVPCADDIVEEAVTRARVNLLRGTDDLCCGAGARIEILLTAADVLGRPELARAARQAARHVVARARATGGYRLGWAGGYAPVGLFRGLAGVGYMLLRAAGVVPLPSPLVWS